MEQIVWGCCQSPTAADEDYIQCTNCANAYHFGCIGVPGTAALTPPWICPTCECSNSKSNSKTVNNDDTPNVTMRPSKRLASKSPPFINIASTSESDEKRLEAMVSRALKSEMDELASRMENSFKKMFLAEFRSIKDEMREVKDSMNFMNEKFEEVLIQQAKTRKELLDLQNENDCLKSTVKELSTRLNTLEQGARSNNVEIQCVPEKKNENLLATVLQIGTAIDCNITSENVLHCTRVAKLNTKNPRPRSIVVQFNNIKTRDRFMAAAITFNKHKKVEDKLNSTHIGFAGAKTPIFITDHLSPSNRALHAAARAAAKEKGYKHVWVRGGRIFMRKQDDSDFILIRNMDYLNNIK